ncbi:ABZJ_00895 family protein [Mesorhizobium sp. INR15]|uniref:ABZJ_00895 family protein n=1 Tax=Mesorhizobium sp. INR15 TaxID=2654248 RepID=UPI0018964A8A|nr:ABZJ_00895 family protein [Mesorhizobium sp. INR15]QPC91177.1 hypothetical protein GA829_11535 [Mesorhizobium sp. INR15]
MSKDDVQSVSVLPYVWYYTIMTFVLTIVLVVVLNFLLSLSEDAIRAAGFIITIGSTIFAYYKFIKGNGRLLNRQEYWRMVALSTLGACLISALEGGLALMGGAAKGLGNVPLAVWAAGALFGFLLVFSMNAAGFGGRFGKTMLKAVLAKRAKVDTETFR